MSIISIGIRISSWPHSSMQNSMIPRLHHQTVKNGAQPSRRKFNQKQPLSLLFLDYQEKPNAPGNSKLRMEIQLLDSNWHTLITSKSIFNGLSGSPRQVLEQADFSQLQMLLTTILVLMTKPRERGLIHKKKQVLLDGIQRVRVLVTRSMIQKQDQVEVLEMLFTLLTPRVFSRKPKPGLLTQPTSWEWLIEKSKTSQIMRTLRKLMTKI